MVTFYNCVKMGDQITMQILEEITCQYKNSDKTWLSLFSVVNLVIPDNRHSPVK